jgi:cytochrome c oxidase assembly protein subunit 11
MNQQSDDSKQTGVTRKMNAQMLGKLAVVAILMFGFGYALVPVYKKICEVTGINILTPKDSAVEGVGNTQIDKTRTITVELDANAQGPWRFRPTVSSVQVHPGEMKQVLYEVVNNQSRSFDLEGITSFGN